MSRPDVTRKRLVIAFDAECLVTPNPSGVGYYTRGLIQSLADFYQDDVTLVGHYCSFLGRKQPTNLPQAPNISYVVSKTVSVRVFNMLRRLGVPVPFETLIRRRADFHLFPAFIGWPSVRKTPSAPVIHDTTFLDHPEYVNGVVRHDLIKLVPKQIARSAFVITNSEQSAKQLRRHLRIGNKPVVVGHIPPVNVVAITPGRAKNLMSKLGISKKFILFLGNLEPRKNLVALVEAYSSLDQKLRDEYSLVLAGGKGWNDNEIYRSIEQAKKQGISIITPGYVTEEQRAALYSQSSMFVLVSTYEGFGMPLLEAMRYKTPILASDIPVLHEVAGDAALYCKTSAADISSNIFHLLSNTKLRQKLVALGEKQVQKFSWRTVSELVYSKIRGTVK